MNDTEHLATIQHLSERLAEYEDTVRDVVQLLGHEGNDPVDLRDALGEIERLLAGESSCERNDLQGLAETLRSALWHRERAESLLASTRAQLHRRTAERDIALSRRADASAAGLMLGLCLRACTADDVPTAAWLLARAVEDNDLLVGLAALRVLWRLRSQLGSWQDSLDRMRAKCIARGGNPTELMAGLDDD